ncbi:MAG TPA: hypothetical protein VGD17_09010, partial [Chitinophagaceae bacterium]
ILDKNYRLEDTVDLFPGESLRIPKKIKTDLEASTIIQYKNREHLMVAGSASRPEREYVMLFPLDSLHTYEKITTQPFVARLRSMGMKPVNFEGLAAVKNMLVFGNRGNLKRQDNHFVVVPVSLVTDMENSSPHLIDFNLSEDGQFKGVSGLAYVETLDLMLFTASIEDTDNEIDDGGIGNSYLGYITSFSERMNDGTIRPDVLWNLSGMQAEFVNEKIESVTVESVGSELILHLVADNDNGTSTLFKVSLTNPLR